MALRDLLLQLESVSKQALNSGDPLLIAQARFEMTKLIENAKPAFPIQASQNRARQ